MQVKAYFHSLKDHKHNRHTLGETEIIECIGDNLYLAEYNDVRCTAIFNFFTRVFMLTTCTESGRWPPARRLTKDVPQWYDVTITETLQLTV